MTMQIVRPEDCARHDPRFVARWGMGDNLVLLDNQVCLVYEPEPRPARMRLVPRAPVYEEPQLYRFQPPTASHWLMR